MKQLILIFFYFFFLSCNRVDNSKWKYQDGYNIGDFLEFGTDVYSLSNDTILRKSKPIAVVIDNNNRLIDRVLIIRGINDTIRGYYISKGKK
jgi:hypothetical protein